MGQINEVPVACGGCGHTWDTALKRPLTLSPGDSLSFAVGSVEAVCPECGASVSNASTSTETNIEDGRRFAVIHLGAVIKDLAARDRDELVALRAEVDRLRERQDAAAADHMLRRTGLQALLGSQGNRMEIWAVLTLVSAVIAMVIALRPPEVPNPTRADIEQIVVSVTIQLQGLGGSPP